MTLLRTVVRHPWRMRRWLAHPASLWRILRRERRHAAYEKREGHPYFGPIPADSWPRPIPEGFGKVFRCVGCGQLGYDGTHSDQRGCLACGSGVGVVVGRYGSVQRQTEGET